MPVKVAKVTVIFKTLDPFKDAYKVRDYAMRLALDKDSDLHLQSWEETDAGAPKISRKPAVKLRPQHPTGARAALVKKKTKRRPKGSV